MYEALILLTGVFVLNIFPALSKSADNQIREAQVAGSFYPADKAELSAMIGTFLSAVTAPAPSEPPAAIIAPHAGYVYSGPVAAYAYAALKKHQYNRVVIISPSHITRFKGAAVYNGKAYRTPFGDAGIDASFSKKLAASDPLIQYEETGHTSKYMGRGEHALEVQLPFLQYVLGSFDLVAIVMGDQSYETARSLGRSLAALIEDRKTLIVASSDLSHFHEYQEAKQLDQKVIDAVRDYDYYNLSRNCQSQVWEACGGGPVVAAMIASEYLGADDVQLLKYANSGDVSAGDKSRVVGYAAFAITRQKTDATARHPGFELSEEEQTILMQIARKAVWSVVAENEKYVPDMALTPLLQKDCAAFVTLKKAGRLRGCIGYTSPLQPLYLTVRDVAVQAATSDPRFDAVNPGELKSLQIEISVLSPLRHVSDIDQIKVGHHGLLIRRGQQTGLLLPQVPVEQGWDLKTFLEYTSRKAGLSRDAWRDEESDLFVFSAFVFNDGH